MKKINISKKILKQVGKTNFNFNLIKKGDKVLLGLSGGKDSLCLAHILKQQQRYMPFDFEFQAVTIAYGMKEDLSHLTKHCKDYDIKHEVQETQIYKISHEKIRKNSSACSFFSRMRRGALYSYAIKNGFNKLALGHHLDDATESYFMNLFYNGAMRSLAPIYRSKRELTVIRPLIEIREKQLLAWADENDMKVIRDEMCPALRFDVKQPYARAKMKSLLHKIQDDFPDLFKSIKTAFKNIHDDTFFDISRHKN